MATGVTDHPSGEVGAGPLKDPERRRAADAAGTIRHSSEARNSGPRRSGNFLGNNGLKGSMGRVASPSDNTALDRMVFSLLEKNSLDTGRCRQRPLGKLTPVAFETSYVAANAT